MGPGAFHQSNTLFDHNLSFSGSRFRFSANINLSTTTYKNQDPTLTLSPSSFYQLIASAFHHFYQNHSHFLQNQDQTLFKNLRKNLATLLFKTNTKTKIRKTPNSHSTPFKNTTAKPNVFLQFKALFKR